MKLLAGTALTVILLAACSCFGNDAPKPNPLTEALAAVPGAELPAKAADLVVHTKARDRQAATIKVVKGALAINPAAAPAIVGAIAGAVPEMAPLAAGAAAIEQPKQASVIAKAAAAAAPAKAAKIVIAVCRAVPNEYRNIAVAVSQVVPGASEEIVMAVAAALPDLKAGIEQVLAGSGGNVFSVASALDQAAKLSPTTTASGPVPPIPSTPAVPLGGPVGPGPRGPAIGPPYIPLTVTPTYVTPGTSGEVPTGGRSYAAP